MMSNESKTDLSVRDRPKLLQLVTAPANVYDAGLNGAQLGRH